MAVNKFLLADFVKIYGKDITFEELKKLSFAYGMEIGGELQDEEFEVDITPERPDMYSIEGFARALRGFSGLESGLIEHPYKNSNVEIIVERKTADIRPYIGAAIIKNIKVDDPLLRSIIRFQEKLHLTLGRKRKKIAIGIYDFDKIKPPVHYRAVNPKSKKFVPLGFKEELTLEEILEKHPTGKEYKHLLEGFGEYPLLVDSEKNVLSFPPIINSDHSGKVTEETKNLFVEVTGTHEPTLIKTVNMLSTSIADRGGKLERVKIKYHDREMLSPSLGNERLIVSMDFINDYLGLELNTEEVKNMLEKMLYGVKIENDALLEIRSPSYRIDVLAPCDIVEDIAIAYGYGNFRIREPHTHTIGRGYEREEFSTHIREICAGIGLTEVMTLILTNTHDQYKRINMPIDTDYISLLDSKSSEHDIVRVRVLPELMKFLRNNKKRESPISIFEVEDVISVDKDNFTNTRDIRTLALAEMASAAEYARVRSLVSSVFDNLGVQYKINESNMPYFMKGRQGEIYVNEQRVGELGEVHPQVINNFGIELPVIAAEIDLDQIHRNARRRI